MRDKYQKHFYIVLPWLPHCFGWIGTNMHYWTHFLRLWFLLKKDIGIEKMAMPKSLQPSCDSVFLFCLGKGTVNMLLSFDLDSTVLAPSASGARGVRVASQEPASVEGGGWLNM